MTKFEAEGALREFFEECDEILQRITSLLTKSESQELSAEGIDSLYRDVHTLKGSSQLFGFQRIGLVAHAIEASLEPVRQKKVKLDRVFIDLVFISLDLVDRILKKPKLDLDNDPELDKDLLQVLPRLVSHSNQRFGAEFELTHSFIPKEDNNLSGVIDRGQIQGFKLHASPNNDFHVLENTKPIIDMADLTLLQKPERVSAGDEQHLESSTIRVQIRLLDKLMNLVGEMVLARNQVLQFARTSENNDFLNLTQRLDLVTTELQDNVMRTRMQPIGAVFTKFQRVVRDLSRELGKNIEFVVEGAETELDKSLLEAIKDPLTHIVRNSCDHGIETPDERKKKGKPAQGTLSLKAYHEGGHVIIEIRDNGRGLEPKKILAKALKNKIILPQQAETLSISEIQHLIFAPGFSTAEHVSAVSGRGVGMDVVRTNIERVGGLIELSSKVDQGTKLRLMIPLTLAIVPALIIKTHNNAFAIPQNKLQELIRVDTEENDKTVEKLQGQFVYRLRGELLPLVDLNELLKPDIYIRQIRKIFNIIVLKSEGHSYGLVVDEICDTADIVVKPLPQFLKRVDVFSGATIMGDGSVALILDTHGVSERSGTSRIDKNKDIQFQDSASLHLKSSEITEYLFFQLSQPNIFSIPLVLVQRLEEFNISEIQVSGSERMVKYRNSLLPLIYLNQFLGYKANLGDDENEKISVVVVSKHNRYFGLVVNDILDILSSSSSVTPHLKEVTGIIGTIIFNEDKIITIIDAHEIIDDALGIAKDFKKQKKLSNIRVLFAEDTIFFVRQVKKVLEEIGLEVDHVMNGQLALDKLKQSPQGHYKLILSDIEMPEMNGYEFAKTVKGDNLNKGIPMIALTTRFNEVDQKRGYDSGFDKYLEKLKSDELVNVIYELLGVH